jgi:hypothetical protein
VPGDLMTYLPTRWHAQLHDALGMEIRYRHDPRQVTIQATRITATPGALAQIICQRDNLPPPWPPRFRIQRNAGVASQIRHIWPGKICCPQAGDRAADLALSRRRGGS